MRLMRAALLAGLAGVATACEDPTGSNSLPDLIEGAIAFAEPDPPVVRVGETAELRLRLGRFKSGRVAWRVRNVSAMPGQGAMAVTGWACVPAASCTDGAVRRSGEQDVFEATSEDTVEVVLQARGVTPGQTPTRAAALGCFEEGPCDAWSEAFALVQVVAR